MMASVLRHCFVKENVKRLATFLVVRSIENAMCFPERNAPSLMLRLVKRKSEWVFDANEALCGRLGVVG